MNDEYLFMFLLIICMSPSEKCLSKSFAHFETRLWDFLDMYTPLCSFICLLCWVFVAVHGLSLLSERGLLLWGFFCGGAQALCVQASVVVALGLSCSLACGLFPDQGLNLCPLNWQADSYPSCGILVPWPGIKPRPSTVRAWSPNHWTTRKSPKTFSS